MDIVDNLFYERIASLCGTRNLAVHARTISVSAFRTPCTASHKINY